ncbi:hypothetical protein [Desulforamulus ruminis]|nr:hypothetical protein [Desulforamulus ruminis]
MIKGSPFIAMEALEHIHGVGKLWQPALPPRTEKATSTAVVAWLVA